MEKVQQQEGGREKSRERDYCDPFVILSDSHFQVLIVVRRMQSS